MTETKSQAMDVQVTALLSKMLIVITLFFPANVTSAETGSENSLRHVMTDHKRITKDVGQTAYPSSRGSIVKEEISHIQIFVNRFAEMG